MQFWDFRHPVKQLANLYMASYRDQYPDKPNLPALEYTVNKIISEATDLGYAIFADGTQTPLRSVDLSYKTVDGNEVLNVNCNC